MSFDIFMLQPDGSYRRFSDDNAERAYPFDTVSALLREAGFRSVKVYADLSLQTPGAQEERWCFVAEK